MLDGLVAIGAILGLTLVAYYVIALLSGLGTFAWEHRLIPCWYRTSAEGESLGPEFALIWVCWPHWGRTHLASLLVLAALGYGIAVLVMRRRAAEEREVQR